MLLHQNNIKKNIKNNIYFFICYFVIFFEMHFCFLIIIFFEFENELRIWHDGCWVF